MPQPYTSLTLLTILMFSEVIYLSKEDKRGQVIDPTLAVTVLIGS